MKKMKLKNGLSLVIMCLAYLGILLNGNADVASRTMDKLKSAIGEHDSHEITIDVNKKFQLMDGFGACGNSEILVKDLDLSVIRIIINPSVLSWVVDDWRDIKWQDFKFTGASVTNQEKNYQKLAILAKLAKDKKGFKFFGTPFTPPGWMKNNDTNSYGGNLMRKYHKHYAKYLAEWIKMLRDKWGIPLYAMSVNNELNFVEPYSSCVYKLNDGQFGEVVQEMGEMFETEGVGHVKVLGPEHMTSKIGEMMAYMNEVLDNPKASKYFGVVASHGYAADGITSSDSAEDSVGLPAALKAHPKYPGWPLWMTESSGELAQWEDGTRMVKGKRSEAIGAFGFGGKVHVSIVYGSNSAYVYWNANRASHSKDNTQGLMVDDVPTKKYYSFKHYSKYIRPNAVRISAMPIDTQNRSASAYYHKENSTLTIVLLNSSEQEEVYPIIIKNGLSVEKMSVYQTTGEEGMDFKNIGDINFSGGKSNITMPRHSIITLYGKVK